MGTKQLIFEMVVSSFKSNYIFKNPKQRHLVGWRFG